MTEYQALQDEIARILSRAHASDALEPILSIVERELSARDAVIEQIRALAEAFYRDSEIAGQSVGDARAAVRSARCASDIERILSALPSTEATG